MSTPYRDETLTLNDCKIHYMDWGNAGAPPLVMVHGLTRQAHAFDGTAERLRERYHCMALDVRGRGESAWAAPETYNYEQYVADLLAFLEAKGLTEVHFLGTSMGGHIGMHLAAQHAGLFLSFLLNDIGPESAAAGSDRIQKQVGESPASYPHLDDLVERELERFPWQRAIPKAQYERALQWQVRKNEDGGWRFHYDPQIIQGRLTDPKLREAAQKRMWRGFKALTCPIMLVRGEESDLLDMSTVEAMQGAQPEMTLVRVPGVGHAPSLEEYPVVKALDKFYG